MTEIIKKFDQLYVGFDYRNEGSDDDGARQYCVLGFATPFEKNAAGAKRRETVDNWGSSRPLNEDGTPNMTKTRSSYRGDKYGFIRSQERVNGKWKDVQVEIPKEFRTSQIIENVPLPGFRISDSVKRYGWNGGNVVWRVLDPRGFELEISSANLQKIIEFVGMGAGGIIPGNCVWCRVAGVNILVPDASPEWQKMLADQTKLDANKNIITVGTAKIGDLIESKAGPAIYLGQVYLKVRSETKESQANYKIFQSSYRSYYGRQSQPAFRHQYQVDVKGPYHLMSVQYDKSAAKKDPLRGGHLTVYKSNPVMSVTTPGVVKEETCIKYVARQSGSTIGSNGYMDIVAVSRNKAFTLEYTMRDVDLSTLIVNQFGHLSISESTPGKLVVVLDDTRILASPRIEVRGVGDLEMRELNSRSNATIKRTDQLNVLGQEVNPTTMSLVNHELVSLYPRNIYYNGLSLTPGAPTYKNDLDTVRKYAATLNLKRAVALIDGVECDVKIR